MNLSPAKRNAAVSYANFGVVAVAGLILNPVLLSGLGASAFGVWRASQRFLDFASVTDGRAAQALKWVVAHKSAHGTDHDRRSEVGATLFVWLLWLPALLVVSGLLVVSLPSLIKGVEDAEITSVYWVGALLAANLVLYGLLSVPDAVLVGTNQGYRSMLATTTVFVGTNLAMGVAVLAGSGIVTLAVIVLAGSFVNGAATWALARRHVGWWGVARPNRTQVGRMAKFSGWVLAWSLASKLLISTELIVISAMVGAATVADYALTSYVIQFALSICLMTTSALMPRLGALLGSGDLDRARSVAKDAKTLTLLVATVAGSGVLIFNRSFISIWVGEQHFLGSAVNGLMTLAFVQLAVIRSDAQIQDTGLNIRRKVLIGSAAALASLVGGMLGYHVTGSLVIMYLGITAPRVALNLIFPFLVERLVPGVRVHPLKYVFAATMLIVSYFIGQGLAVDRIVILVPFAVGSGLLVSVTAFCVLLPRATRQRILRSRTPRALGEGNTK